MPEAPALPPGCCALLVRDGIRGGDGSEHLGDRAARRRETAELTAYVVRQGVRSGT